MTDQSYTAEDQRNAMEASLKLGEFALSMATFMSPHAVATAFMSVAVSYACKHLPPHGAAKWLCGIANEIHEHATHSQNNGYTN